MKTAEKQKDRKLQLSELMPKGIDAYLGKDYQTSFYCFSQAAALGDANAEWMVGRCYQYGQGCKQSYRKAAQYYKRASAKQVKKATYELAKCYRYGLGVHKSQENAIKFLTLSADQGYSLAQEFLAKQYLAGDEVEIDEEKAVYYFSKAADQGCADSQYFMWLMYKMGYVSEDTAIKYLKVAAGNGHAKAQRCLGELFFHGDLGLPEDKSLAFYLCHEAAQQHDPEACYCVGLSYLKGDGVPKDIDSAKFWLKKAAEQNYSDAQLALARLLLREKTETGYKQAKEWLSRGVALGNEECKRGLGLLKQMNELGISWAEYN